jgi:hypothetical protein
MALVTRAQHLLAGTKKHFANAGTLSFASASLTPAQIEASLQALVDLRQGVEAAKAATQAKINDEATQAPPLLRQLTAYAAFVKVTFANSPDVLADFGLKPNKARTPLTVEQRTVAVARGKATRTARHTMGTQQKKSVKGTVNVAVVVTPATASTATTPGSATPRAT